MSKHLRANLWLLGLTVFVCCFVYFLIVWVVAKTVFPRTADGTLVVGSDGIVVGSRLIAQPFTGDEYFHPRPSAVAYNATASGATNWGPSHYLLRDRVARQLGPIVRYRDASRSGRSVQQDIDTWFKGKPDVIALWVDRYPSVARLWVTADEQHKAAVRQWQGRHPEAVAEWRKSRPAAGDPEPADLAAAFFRGNAKAFHTAWPTPTDDPSWSLPAVFFDMWLHEHPEADIERVPGDLVMASGSGLDPHITRKNARYQLDRVAGAWAQKTGLDKDRVRARIETLLDEKQEAPLAGWVGVPLVNVLDVNLALAGWIGAPARPAEHR
jgi:K+-transporting ATPase ATPase C chain